MTAGGSYGTAIGWRTSGPDDEWAEGRRYLGLDVLARCRLRPVTDTSTDEEVTGQPTIPALSA